MSQIERKGKKKIMDKGEENGNGNGNDKLLLYPQPLAKYTDVISDKNLFMQTLGKLHAAMKTKFMVPIIGGRELDLHQLFIEVTSRGGIEKVIEQRRWREVTASFSFPSTATNASFVLRKYYMSLLRHYEQVYYFGSRGWSTQSNDNNGSSPPTPKTASVDSQAPTHKRKIKDEPAAPSATYPTVVGVIDGKFDHGYFITVTAGSQKLRGVLYHIPDISPDISIPPHSLNIPHPVSFGPGADVRGDVRGDVRPVKRRRRRKRRLSRMDPDHPKPNRSGYNFFFKEQHARLKPLHPGRDREISRMIGELWNNLSEHEKDVYQERGRADKERYQNEMVVYREKQMTGSSQVISHAVPLDQRPGPEMTVQGVDLKIQEGNLVLYNNNNDGVYSDGMDEEDEEDEEEGEDKDLSEDLDSLDGVGADVAGPSGERKNSESVGFELRKREIGADKMDLDVEVSDDKLEEEAKLVKEFSDKAKEGDLKLSEDLSGKLKEGEAKLGEDLIDKVEKSETKLGEGLNDKLKEGESKLGEDSNDELKEGGELKVSEDLDDKLEMSESKLGGDSNVKLVEGDVKLGEDLKMVDAEVSNEDKIVQDA
ncbi:hypothetical protein LUZ60_004710 [Juncus effusus]|nr:hypothetical protein LUZ60_004710 [Juncus effusus]